MSPARPWGVFVLVCLIGFLCVFREQLALTVQPINIACEHRAVASVDFSSRCNLRPKVIVYNRIPTAGSSTTLALIRKLAELNNFTLVGLNPPFNSYSKASRAIMDAITRPERTLIAGHFHFPEIFFGKDVEYINLLREPVSRIVSDYYYLRYGNRGRNDKIEVLQTRGNFTLDECVRLDDMNRKRCLNEDFVNILQSRYLCGRDGGECEGLALPEVSARAMNNMNSVYTVGLLENYREFLQLLELAFPEFFRGASSAYHGEQKNIARTKPDYIAPGQETIHILSKLIKWDVKLHKQVESQQQQHLQACSSVTKHSSMPETFAE